MVELDSGVVLKIKKINRLLVSRIAMKSSERANYPEPLKVNTNPDGDPKKPPNQVIEVHSPEQAEYYQKQDLALYGSFKKMFEKYTTEFRLAEVKAAEMLADALLELGTEVDEKKTRANGAFLPSDTGWKTPALIDVLGDNLGYADYLKYYAFTTEYDMQYVTALIGDEAGMADPKAVKQAEESFRNRVSDETKEVETD